MAHATTYDVAELPLELIEATSDNRDLATDRVAGLAASIARVGLEQPLSVYPVAGGRYRLRAGHHRAAALRLLGRATAPCIVGDPPATDADRHAARCASNWARVDTTPADDWRELSRLVAAGHDETALCEISGHGPVWVRNRLALGTIDPSCHWIATRHGIGWATGLAGLPGDMQRALARALEETKPSRARWEALLERSRQRAAERAAEQGATFDLVQETWTTDHAAYVDELGAADESAPAAPAPTVREIPIGIDDVARRLGVKADTVQKWRRRDVGFPLEAGSLSGAPYWWAADVDHWASKTGRA